MIPIKFEEANIIFRGNQLEDSPTPIFKSKEGTVVSCWGLSFVERLKILIRGKLWLTVMTFNAPLQLPTPDVECPLIYTRAFKKLKEHERVLREAR
jgi:hypothetical protein